MENLFIKMKEFIVQFIVIGFFTFVCVTPLFLFFYLIIFKTSELSTEISVKTYATSYSIAFVINFFNRKNLIEKH
jgi:hypothetical protein